MQQPETVKDELRVFLGQHPNFKEIEDYLPTQRGKLNTPPETVPLDRTNGALRPLKWCMVTAVMVH